MNNEIELTAALLTIEKCRELSGCPAGVDLQEWLKQLAAENVGLRAACGGDGSYRNCPSCTFSEYIEAPETPATDRIVAGIKADAANQMCVAFVKHKELAGLSDDDVVTVREATDAVLHCAEVISEGADK